MSFLSAMSERDGTTEVDFSQILCAYLTYSSPHREGRAILEEIKPSKTPCAALSSCCAGAW